MHYWVRTAPEFARFWQYGDWFRPIFLFAMAYTVLYEYCLIWVANIDTDNGLLLDGTKP